jgi:PKD repeat protein
MIMKSKHLRSVLFLLTVFTTFLQAQSNLFIDNSYTIEEMVQDFFDNPNVVTSNVTYTGAAEAVAFFDAGGTDLGVGAGILFTTGSAAGVAAEASVFLSSSNSTPGDDDLTLLMDNVPSNDAVIIEFDFFIAESDTFNFNYVFGSEEYPEFTCTTFNDGFGFLVSGPGTAGPYSNNAHNICMIPNSSDAVAINTINDNPECGDASYTQYYIDNSADMHIVYDGLTTSLPASFYAVGGETYHAKLVLGDGGDSAFDSGVFLSFNSLGADSLLVPPSNFSIAVTGNVVELANTSKYATDWFWDFGNGVTSTERNPGPVSYEDAGTYTISLTTQNFCCTDTYTTEVVVEGVNGLFSDEEVLSLNVFPNPVQKTLFVQHEASLNVKNLHVLNLLGESFMVDYEATEGVIEVDVPDGLPKGVYLMQIQGVGGKRFVARFVKE